LEKGKVVNTVFTEPIQLIQRISEVLGSSDRKKEMDVTPSMVTTLTKNPIFQI
jgi:hypothetical protein